MAKTSERSIEMKDRRYCGYTMAYCDHCKHEVLHRFGWSNGKYGKECIKCDNFIIVEDDNDREQGEKSNRSDIV